MVTVVVIVVTMLMVMVEKVVTMEMMMRTLPKRPTRVSRGPAEHTSSSLVWFSRRYLKNSCLAVLSPLCFAVRRSVAAIKLVIMPMVILTFSAVFDEMEMRLTSFGTSEVTLCATFMVNGQGSSTGSHVAILSLKKLDDTQDCKIMSRWCEQACSFRSVRSRSKRAMGNSY